MIDTNVQLWFGKDTKGNIITIDEVDKNKKDKYYCPICGSEILPRQGKINDWCFAHIDKSKCSNESIYHFWYKNKLLQQDDKFIIRTDSDKEYICKEILVEQSYKIEDKIYKPDLTVICEDGEIIYFEFDYTNKKKLQDYIDSWIKLGNTVVEIDIKTLLNYKKDKLPIFKALWYEGKCFNVKKGEDELYYNTIGKYKEQNYNKEINDKIKSDLERLDWLWNNIKKYKTGEVNIEHISNLIQNIEDEGSKDIIVKVLRKTSCQNIIKDYINCNIKYVNNIIKTLDSDKNIFYSIKTPHKIFDRLFNLQINFKYKNSNTINISRYLFTKEYIDNLIDNIKKEITEENNIVKQIKKLKKYVKSEYNYNSFCKCISLINEPYLNDSIEWRRTGNYGIRNEYNLDLNCFPSYCGKDYILVNKNNDIIKAQEIIKRKASYNTYKFFSKEDVLKIDDVAQKLCEKFNKNNITVEFYIYKKEYIEINIKYDEIYNKKITLLKDKNFQAINLYKHLYLLISLRIKKVRKYVEKIKYFNSILDDLNKIYENDDTIKEWHLKLINNNYIYIYKNKEYMFRLCKTVKEYFKENYKITRDNLRRKINNITKHKILEYMYEEIREPKYSYNLKDMRNYKKNILKDLKKSNFQITRIKPMCNKPYILLEYEKEISHIIFLSQYDYNNCKINLENYDIITILNKNIVSESGYYEESIKDYIIININEKYDFINRNQLVKSIIKSKIKESNYNYNKKINLFYYKSRPQNKKYRNLNKFDFIKAIDILEFINDKYSNKIHNEKINRYISELPYNISNIDILKQMIFNQQDIYNLFNLFFKTINTIQNDEINILLNIKYTNLNNNGYQPWLIEDFIEEAREIGFININNTKGEVI